MHYALAPHIRICRTHCDTVGLDLLRNRYFGLGAKETSLMAHLGVLAHDEAAHFSDVQRSTLTDALLRAGVLIRADVLDRSTTCDSSVTMDSPAASAGYEHNDTVPIRAHHILNLLRAWVWARFVLSRRTLYAISLHLSQARLNTHAPADDARMIALVSAFRQLRPFVYCARERCLLHALTLMRFLEHYDVHPRWFIGVRTRPWAAHSWVQTGVMVLDGRPDDVCDYTPILMV